MTDFPAHHIERIDRAHLRLDTHEQRLTRLETSEQVAAERHKHIEKSLNGIESNLSKVVWLIVGAIIAGLVSFIIKGGLNVG